MVGKNVNQFAATLHHSIGLEMNKITTTAYQIILN